MIKHWWVASGIGLMSGTVEHVPDKPKTIKEAVQVEYISEGERGLLEVLKQEHLWIEKKKEEIAYKEEHLRKEEKIIAQQIEHISQRLSKAEKIWEDRSDHEKEDQKERDLFLKMVEKLPVRQAAPMMSVLESSLAAKILKQFEPKRSASILAMMDPSKSAQIVSFLEQKSDIATRESKDKNVEDVKKEDKTWIRTHKDNL